MPAPRILASFVQSTLDAATRLDAALGERVRARLAPESRRAIESALSIAFLPVELDVEVTEALFVEAGQARACEVLRSNMSVSFEAPVLSSLVSAALRLLGRAPGRLLRWSPKVWSQLYRDAGEIHVVEVGACAARLDFEGLPRCVARSRPYLIGMEAAFGAAFELIGVAGEVRLGEIDPAAGRAVYHFDWKGSDEKG